jgi:hypothetical protein
MVAELEGSTSQIPKLATEHKLSQFHSSPILTTDLRDPAWSYASISFSVFQVDAFLEVSPPKFCIHSSSLSS